LVEEHILLAVIVVEESVVRKIDPQGRISIPIDWRKGWRTDRVVLRRDGDRIELIPIEPTLPSDLFDSVEIGDEVDFTDPHSLRRALLEPGRK
jgi:bifunctional DNA-binding transcriptional regulator/antitoxin component of YhaV-PrlF toxin-antitoxin module